MYIKRLCGTESKAFQKSKYTISVDFFGQNCQSSRASILIIVWHKSNLLKSRAGRSWHNRFV